MQRTYVENLWIPLRITDYGLGDTRVSGLLKKCFLSPGKTAPIKEYLSLIQMIKV